MRVDIAFQRLPSSSPVRGAPKVQGSVCLAQRGIHYEACDQRWLT